MALVYFLIGLYCRFRNYAHHTKQVGQSLVWIHRKKKDSRAR
jgi:hypothetical protein